SPYYVIGLYAALKLGVVVIPINPMYTAHEMKYILLNGDVKAVITMDIFMDKFVIWMNSCQVSNIIYRVKQVLDWIWTAIHKQLNGNRLQNSFEKVIWSLIHLL